jgi:formate dehydrogenase maturation protein FdhE
MVLKISGSCAKQITETLGTYMFKEAKEKRDIEWLNYNCEFYKELKDLESKEQGDITITVNDAIAEQLPSMIEKYIFDDMSQMAYSDMDWACEMMSVYNQLKKVRTEDRRIGEPIIMPSPVVGNKPKEMEAPVIINEKKEEEKDDKESQTELKPINMDFIDFTGDEEEETELF